MLISKGIDNVINDLANNIDSWRYQWVPGTRAMTAVKGMIQVWGEFDDYSGASLYSIMLGEYSYELSQKHRDALDKVFAELERLQTVRWEEKKKAGLLKALKEGGWIK